MTDKQQKTKPGPKPEVFKVPLSFEDAMEAALKTPPPEKRKKRKRAK